MDAEQVKKLVPAEDLKNDLRNQKAANVVFDSAKVGKAPAKKATAKKDEAPAEAEEKKPAAKKTTTKKAAAKKDEAAAETEEKKPTAKKTTKKAKTEE
jgi:trigger factor